MSLDIRANSLSISRIPYSIYLKFKEETELSISELSKV